MSRENPFQELQEKKKLDVMIDTSVQEARPEQNFRPENLEKAREVMRESSIDRASWLNRILQNKMTVADKVGNTIPGVNAIKKAVEAGLGKTLSQKELNGTARVCFAIEAAATASCLIYSYEAGADLVGGALYGASWAAYIANELIINNSWTRGKLGQIKPRLTEESRRLLSKLIGMIDGLNPEQYDSNLLKQNIVNEFQSQIDG